MQVSEVLSSHTKSKLRIGLMGLQGEINVFKDYPLNLPGVVPWNFLKAL